MNSSGSSVRHRAAPVERASRTDRRVRRTQQALVHALIALIAEKRYEAITIRDLLDRADIGRSTFYAHFRGKDDFLLRTFEGLIDLLDRCVTPGDGRLAPVRELFEHVGSQREFHRALTRAKMIDRVYQVGIERMSATIERRLESAAPVAGAAPAPRAVPPAIRARALAGGLFSLMRWWLEEDAPPAPARMDEMFHAMAGRC